MCAKSDIALELDGCVDALLLGVDVRVEEVDVQRRLHDARDLRSRQGTLDQEAGVPRYVVRTARPRLVRVGQGIRTQCKLP